MKMLFMVIKSKLRREIKAKLSHVNIKFFFLLIFGLMLILLLTFFLALKLNGGGLAQNESESGSENGLNPEAKTDGSSVSGIEQPAGLNIDEWFYLDIEGAVNVPGIHVLPVINGKKPRLFQLIDVAGGFHDRVNWQQTRKIVNLAAEVNDGQQIYIPFDFESNEEFLNNKVEGEENDKTMGKIVEEGVMTGDKVSINTASMEELEGLTGVGEVRAQKLIDGRPWSNIEEAVEKKAITQKIVDDNVNKISI